jgi:hypothetical protein
VTGLLTELGKKIADRWLSTLLLPGLLYAAAAVCAYLLGWTHALDPSWLTSGLDRIGAALSGDPAAIVLAVTVALLVATTAGIAAHGLAGAVHRAYLAHGPQWWLLRRRRWARAAIAHRNPRPPTRYLPRRATPIGDRFRLIGERIDAQYGLDTTLVWPRLWLLLPDSTRTAVQSAHGQYQDAITLTGWAVLYLGLGAMWPPALPAAAITAIVGYRRAVAACGVLADLIEASIDTQQHAIAALAGITLSHGLITRTEGLRINDLLNKRA